MKRLLTIVAIAIALCPLIGVAQTNAVELTALRGKKISPYPPDGKNQNVYIRKALVTTLTPNWVRVELQVMEKWEGGPELIKEWVELKEVQGDWKVVSHRWFQWARDNQKKLAWMDVGTAAPYVKTAMPFLPASSIRAEVLPPLLALKQSLDQLR